MKSANSFTAISISTTGPGLVSVRNIRNHVKFQSKGLDTWDGWLIAGNTHDIFVMQNKLILHDYIHFKNILLLFKSFHAFSKCNKRVFTATGEYSN